MPAMTEAQIKAQRIIGYKYMLQQFAMMSSSSVISSHTIKSGNKTAHYSTYSEFGDGKGNMKSEAIKKGVTQVLEKGFAIPEIIFRVDSTVNVANAAFVGDSDGNRKCYVVLSGKYWGTNQSSRVRAGQGAVGVPNKIYDGASRIFDRTRQKAFGTSMVVHELGHVLHEASDPDFFWSNKDPALKEKCTVKSSDWIDQAVEVSLYATTSSVEFVAEFFAGTIAGIKYSNKVKDAYLRCGGPVPASGRFF
jgi:hypothetical protein